MIINKNKYRSFIYGVSIIATLAVAVAVQVVSIGAVNAATCYDEAPCNVYGCTNGYRCTPVSSFSNTFGDLNPDGPYETGTSTSCASLLGPFLGVPCIGNAGPCGGWTAAGTVNCPRKPPTE